MWHHIEGWLPFSWLFINLTCSAVEFLWYSWIREHLMIKWIWKLLGKKLKLLKRIWKHFMKSMEPSFRVLLLPLQQHQLHMSFLLNCHRRWSKLRTPSKKMSKKCPVSALYSKLVKKFTKFKGKFLVLILCFLFHIWTFIYLHIIF